MIFILLGTKESFVALTILKSLKSFISQEIQLSQIALSNVTFKLVSLSLEISFILKPTSSAFTDNRFNQNKRINNFAIFLIFISI